MTCDFGSLTENGSATAEILVTSQTIGTLQNLAEVSSDLSDPNASNNSATTLTDSLNPALDEDGDGTTNAGDCAPLDGDVWAIPSPVQGLTVEKTGPNDVHWSAPTNPGGTVVLYDTLRTDDPSNFDAAVCLESDDTDLSATDGTTPPALYAYLVRAQNACGGTLGTDSAGTKRSGAACP